MTTKSRSLWFGIAWLCLAPSLSAQTCVTAPKGLMGWWRGEGTVASYFGGVPAAGVGVSHEAGKVGLGMRLQGAGAGVALGAPTWLDVQDFTIHAWVRRNSTEAIATDGSGTGWILSRANAGLAFGIQADGKLRFGAMGGTSWVESTETVVDLEFHHVAVVRSGVSVSFVIDGVAAGGGTWPVVLAYGGTSALGRNAVDGSGSFAGLLDEVAFVDRPQSVAQVAAAFGAGSAGLCEPPNDVPNDIGAATERLVQGSGAVGHLLVSSDGFGIDGRLRLESANSGYLSGIAITSGGLTNREGGSISVRRGTEGPREIRGAVLNLGTWDVQWPLTVSSPEENVVNRAALDLTGSGALSLRGAGLRFDLAGGAVTGGNAIDGAGVTVRFLGGSLAGTPWLLGSRLEFDPRNTNAGSFLMTGNGSTLVGGLQPGQSVTVLGSAAGGHTEVVAPMGVRSSGTVRLSSVNSGYTAQLRVTGGRFVNEAAGTLETTRGAEGARVLSGSFVNDGMVRVGWPLTVTGNGGTHEIRGMVEIQPGMTLSWRGPGHTYRQVGGQVQADGLFDMESMRFEYVSGAMTGTIYLAGVDARMSPTGEDLVSLILAGSSSRLSGRLNPGQSVWIRGDAHVGHADVGLGADFVNNGTVRLESANSGYTASVNMPSGSFLNGPQGTLLVRRGAEGPRTVGVELVNEGVFGVQWPATLGRVGAIHRNRGTVSVAAGVALAMSGAGQEFRQEAGLLDLAGTLDVSGMTFSHLGGEIRGQPYLDGVRLRIGEDAVGPLTAILGRSASQLGGRIHPGQEVWIRGDGRMGHTILSSPNGVEVGGDLRIESANSSYTSGLSVGGSGLHVLPGGRLRIRRGAEGFRAVEGPVDNEGTVEVSWPVGLGVAGTVHRNRGVVTVDPGMTLSFPGAGQRFVQAGGTMGGSGVFVMDGDVFRYEGGVVERTVQLIGSRLELPDSAGPGGEFLMGANSEVTGRVPARVTVVAQGSGVAGHTTLRMVGGLRVGGVLRVASANSSYVSQTVAEGGSLVIEPGGTLEVLRGSEGPRAVDAPVVNRGFLDFQWPTRIGRVGAGVISEGRVRMAAGMTVNVDGPMQLARGRFDGLGTMVAVVVNEALVSPGPGLGTLRIEGTYRQGARGILDLEIGDGASDQLVVTGGASLGGLVRVALVPGFDPAVGRTFQLVAGTLDGIRPRVELPDLPSGRSWAIDYTSGMRVRVIGESTVDPAGGVFGQVTGPDGQPVADLPVLATQRLGAGGAPGIVEQYATVTGVDGRYQLALVPGEWLVDVAGTEARGFAAVVPAGITVADALVEQDFVLAESTLGRFPDLAASTPVTSATGVAGGILTVQWTTSNRGESTARKPWRELVMLGRQPSGFDAVEIGRLESEADLAAGADVARELVVNLPVGLSGGWYLFVNVDAGLAVPEGEGEANNLSEGRAIELLIGDLVVESVTAPAQLAWGDTVEIQWVVRNTGGTPVAPPWTDSVYYSATAGGGVLLGDLANVRETPLGPGDRQTNSLLVTIPLGSQNTPGTYFFLVRTDRTGAQPEASDANNLGASTVVSFTRPSPADLVVTGSVLPPVVPAGSPVEVRWTVKNEGLTRAIGPWRDVIELAPSAESTERTVLLAVDFNDALEPGESRERSRQILFPASMAGSHAVFITTDAGDQVFESGPSANNTRVHPGMIAIEAPDLTVRAVAGAGGRFGAAFPVSWEVLNRGNTPTQLGWIDRIVLVGVEGERVIGLPTNGGAGALVPGAVSTQVFNVVVPLDATARAGDYRVRLVADARGDVLESDESNNARESAPFRLDLPPLANLRVESVTAPATGLPGGTVEVTWAIANEGAAVVPAGSVVRLDLVVGATVEFLASLRLDEAIAAGGRASQPTTVRIPPTVAGAIRFRVTADASGESVESNEGDNMAESSAPTEVPSQLSLLLPVASVPENLSPAQVRARVGRSGPLGAALTVTVGSSDTNEVTVPTSVEIPAGRAFAEFDVTIVADGRVDGTKSVQLTASAAGFNPGLATLDVVDVDRAALSLVASTNRVREGLSIPVVLRRSEPATEPVQVDLGTTANGFVLPATLTIPTGGTEVAFALVAEDNDRLEAERTIGIRASASGHAAAEVQVTIEDDDDPGLTLEAQPGQIGEGDGPAAAQVSLRRALGIQRTLRVRVATDNPARLAVPSEVVLPAGQAMVGFAVGAVNNRDNDGVATARVTGSVVDAVRGTLLATAQPATVTIQDDDGASLRISVGGGVAREGRNPAFTGVVLRNSSTESALTVQLSSADTTEATVPGTVVIPAGQPSVTFPVTTLDDGVVDGNQRVTLVATAAGHAPASAAVTVTDGALPDLAFAVLSVPASGVTGGDAAFVYRIVNQGFTAASGPFVQRLHASRDPYLSADDVLIDETPFPGTLNPGEFFQRDLTRRLPREVGTWYVIGVADATGSVTEVLEDNNRAVAAGIVEIQPAYLATVETDVTAAPSGTPVPLRGVARRPGGAVAALELVNVFVRVRGTERVLTVLADGDGRFETTFQPAAGEYGVYEISAGHPGAPGPAAQDTFELLGLRPEPALQFARIVPGVTNTVEVRLVNPNERALTGLQFEASAVDGIGVTVSGPIRLSAGESATVTLRVWSREERDAVGRLVVRATSGEGAFNTFAVDYSVELPQPRLVARPARLDFGMVRGRQQTVEFDVANIGGAESGAMELTLPELPWLRSASATPLPSIAPGGSVRVTLLLTPDETVGLGLHDGRLAVGNDAGRVTVPFSIRHVSDALGDLVVPVHDENTYYGNNALVEGAEVVLRDVFDNQRVRSAVTGTNGTVSMVGVPEGTYNLEVSAPKHDTFLKTVTVLPGVVNRQVAFLRTQLVRYNWTVEEVDFEEQATIRLETIFETTVPVPVLTIEPSAIDLSQVTGDEHTVELRITNNGLIAAQSAELRFEDGSTWKVLPLTDDLGAIPPKSSLTVPVTFIRIGTEGGGSGSGRLAAPAAGTSLAGCRTPSLGVGWELLCGDFGVAYWSPVYVFDPGLCPPPPLVIGRDPLGFLDYIPQYPWVAIPRPLGGGRGTIRGFPIDIGWGPRGFASYSGTNDCNCLKDGFSEKCLQAEAGFKADVADAAEAALKLVLGPIRWISVQGFEVKFSGSGKLCTCCEEVEGQGVSGLKAEGDVGGSVEAKLFAGPQFKLDVPAISVPGLAEAEGEFFIGAGVELTAGGSVKVNAKTECFLADPEVFVEARVQLKTPVGLKGKGVVKGTSLATGARVEYEGEAFGGIDLGAYATVSGYIVGGTGKPRVDGCLDAIVVKAEAKLTRTVNGVFESIGASVQRELTPKVCLNEDSAGAVLAKLPQMGAAEAVSRILGFETPASLTMGVTHNREAADALSATPSGRELSDVLLRHMGSSRVREAAPVGTPVFTQSLGSAEGVEAARREASARRQAARAGRGALPAGAGDAKGVCAQVKLEIEQQAVVTRKGIGTTLEIINESTDQPLEDIGVSIQIYDRDGNVVNDRFVILPPELTRLQPMSQAPTNRLLLGGLALTLPPDATGSARWLIVPKDTAAPEEETEYFVGGHLAYRSGAVTKTAELTPGMVRVYPNARLYLKYFHQRDVFADDPFTDVVEPSEPFVLGVMVHNRGRGLARNFSITSGQPRIVDNAKGLLVNFDIIATEVAGRSLSPSLTANFGDIDPGGVSIGRWLLKSSIQGLFLDYQATLEHEDRFGERGASVFEGVEIHELIRQVEAGGTFADGRPDFLVNDEPDDNDLPDTLHLSDGSATPVSVLREAEVDGAPAAGDLEVEMTVRAPSGWVYVRVPEPSRGTWILHQVRRSDGAIVPVANRWVTDRTFVGGGKRPIPGHVLHLLDHGSSGRYTLVYRRDETLPDTTAPASQVAALGATNPVQIPVRWSGTDDAQGSGVDSYDIFVSTDGAPFQRWLTSTRNQSAFYPAAAGRVYAFYSVARDRSGNVEPSPATPDAATQVVGNSAPQLATVPDVVVDEGQRAEALLRGSDLDLPGDTLRYELVSGPQTASLDGATGQFAWQTSEADGPGTATIRVRVVDDGEPPAATEREFRVIVREVNQPVSLREVSAVHAVEEGRLFELALATEDADLPPNAMRFTLLPGAPEGASVDASAGLVRWIPSEIQGGKTHGFTVEVSDQGSPATTARVSFRVEVAKANSAPRFAPIAGGVVWEGDLVERLARAVDEDLPPQSLAYALAAGGPTGAGIDAVTGRFIWVPLEEHASRTNRFTVIATDDGEPVLSSEATFAIVVRPLHLGLNRPARSPAGEVSFRFKRRIEGRHRLEGSEDLEVWTPLMDFTADRAVVPVVDSSSAVYPWRFFRVVEVP